MSTSVTASLSRTRDFDHTALMGSDAARVARVRSSGTEVRTYVWHLWPGRNFPCTAREEATFLQDMRSAVGTVKGAAKTKKVAFDRGDVTSVMNALRCGLTFAELQERAPGLKPARLLAAYLEVDRLRAQSVNAWLELVADGGLESIVNWASAAAVLMGTPVRRVQPISNNLSEELLRDRVKQVQERVLVTVRQGEKIEKVLDERRVNASDSVELGRLLYDPYDPSLWADPYFLPERVGTLMPLRLADLLGERRL